jgi:lipopolysaccharide export system protein LptC
MTARVFFLLCLAAATAGAATKLSDQPVLNFRLPTFTPEGYRDWLFRGDEARYLDANHIEIKEMALTVFTGTADNRAETLILSPSARLAPQDQTVTGDGTIRIINDRFEATGSKWTYQHAARKVTLGKDVRVRFKAELKNLLQ